MAGKSTSLTVEVITDASRAQAGLNKVAGKVDDLGSKMTKRLAGVALGAGILKFGADSVKAAAQAEQAVGGVGAVFKAQSGVIEKAAAGAAKAIGLSTAEYEQLATVLGSQLKTAGFDDVAGKTTELITLGGDLAAMYGGTTADAVSSISSLMRGERDPIEKFGVSMNQAAIDAEVLALGLDTSTASAKKQAQAQAGLSLLYKQTADASGAAAREQDSASARYQQLTATLENLEAQVGSALLPLMSSLAETAMDAAPAIQAVGEAVAGAVAWFSELPGGVQIAAGALAGVAIFGDQISKLGDALKRVKTVGLGKSLSNLFGGPWVMAAAAAVAIIGTIASAISDSESSTIDYTEAIDENTGALKENAAQTIAKKLAESGAGDTLRAAGVSMETFTAAVLGNGPAIDEIAAKWEAAKGNAAGMADAASSAGGSQSQWAGQMLASAQAADTGAGSVVALGQVMHLLGIETTQLATDQQQIADGLLQPEDAAGAKAVGGAYEEAAKPADAFKDAIEGMGSAASVADSALQFLLISIDQANGGTITAEAAMRANEAAFRAMAAATRDVDQANADLAEKQAELTKLQDEGGHSAAELEQAQRDVADAADAVADAQDGVFNANQDAAKSALGMATAAYAQKAATGDLEGAAAAANAVIEEQRAKFLAAQSAADRESGAADILATKLFGIPGEVGTTLKANDQASPVVDTYTGKLKSLDGTIVTTYIKGEIIGATVNGKKMNAGMVGNDQRSLPLPPAPDEQLAAAGLLGSQPFSAAAAARPTALFGTKSNPLVVPMTLAVSGRPAQQNIITYNITVTGAVDSDASARQIEQLLKSRQRRGSSVTAQRGLRV